MKTRNRFLFAAAGFLLTATALHAQYHPGYLPDYGRGAQVLTATPGTQGGAAAAAWNPAAWAAMRKWEVSFLWNDRNVNDNRLDNWGLFLGGNGVGFAMQRHNVPWVLRTDEHGRIIGRRTQRVDDYQIGLGGGEPDNYWGMSYGWAKGEAENLPRDHYITMGSIYRPVNYLSIGNAASLTLDRGDYRAISDVGVRPLRSHRLTLFADAAYGRRDNFNTLQWGAGLEIMPLNGLRVAAKLAKPQGLEQDKIVSLSLGVSLDGTGFHVVPHYDKDNERLSTSYLVRLGEQEPSFDVRKIYTEKEHVVSVPLRGKFTYQKARWFDRNKIELRETLQLIDDARRDPSVEGILLNLSDMEIPREPLWEIREKLKEFKAAGKNVYVYVDRAGMAGYSFATVADKIWIDPMGMLTLPGYVTGRTFYKNFLTKIGLGSEEWRYFAYKSAAEVLSRTDMSEKDREQRLVLLTDLYDQWERDVTADRGVPAHELRAMVDSMGVLMPEDALAAGLVDTIGTWDDAKDFIEAFSGEKPHFIKRDGVRTDICADPAWGKPLQIAVVYAVGECDMDTGIRGRYTSRVLRQLAKDSNVKAVVLRADSPGGDALPSDLVAREMLEVAKKKPMIVSQGSVAASGGYWISMNGDRIFTAPATVTGSIGVIGAWVWNENFSNKTGFTSDHIKIGEHADMGFGLTLPLLGVQIPDRNLDEYEKRRVESLLRGIYKDFTARVATSRDLTREFVDSVGQGRIWSGQRAVELGLCDEIGGLEQALDYARTQAKIKRGRYEIVEYPRQNWLSPDLFSSPSPVQAAAAAITGQSPVAASPSPAYELSVMRRLTRQPFSPVLMILPEDLPAEDPVW